MKNTKLFVLMPIVAMLSLTACPEAKDPFTNGINLKKDKNKNYVIDEVDNSTGSASYEIFVRSFYDTNGDGIGDLKGVQEKLSYIKDMGIKTIWLLPVHPSPSYHGYDVDNYYEINKDYGTMEDFNNLVNAAKEKGIDVMMDLVLNHSSTFNKWFTQSAHDYLHQVTGADSKADWYNWNKDGKGCKWTDGLYYEGSFNSSMPDLNLSSESLRSEIDNILKFWLNKGVAGFRLDAVTYYYSNNVTKNNEFLNWLNTTAKKYNPNVYMVGEAWVGDAIIPSYYGSSSKPTINSFFNFGSASGSTSIELSLINASKGVLKSKTFAEAVENYEKKIKSANKNAYSSYFVSNHDQNRMSAYFKDERAKTIASLYLLLPGTPFMYYGEEIELRGTRSSEAEGTDAKRRLPMIWSKKDKVGECAFPDKEHKYLDTTEQVELGVYDNLKTNYSLINHYKKVINVRNKYPFFKNAYFQSLCSGLGDESGKVMAYKIYNGNDYVIVVHNFSDYNQTVTSPGTEIVDTINTSRQIPELNDGMLSIGHHSTVLLK